MFFKQNTFSRSLANDQKMGAYYTDVSMCERIGRLFAWPDDEVCVLEPSIGDGTAVAAVTKDCTNRTLFGVELNEQTASALSETKRVDYLLNADFLKGVKISRKSFSFCFSNPPYGNDQETGMRLERQFVEKMYGYLTDNAILALVIPYYVLIDEKFHKSFFSRFSPLCVFKFDDKVYKQFQQVVVIGSKRDSVGYRRQALEDFLSSLSLKELPYLPGLQEEISTPIPVAASNAEKIEFFTTLVFDAKKAAPFLSMSPLYGKIQDKMVKPYTATEIGHPAVPLKKDLLYLCGVSGGGQGLVGSKENKDLHLQRGTAKVVVDKEVLPDGKGGTILQEVSRTKIVLNIIEDDGTITCLE